MRSNQRYRSRRRRELGSIKSSSLKLDFISDALDSRITYTGGAYRTKYDANGVLGYAPHNICLQSADLGTTWINARTSESTNTTTAPNGTETADTVIESDAAGTHGIYQQFAVKIGEVYTFSTHAKLKEHSRVTLNILSINARVTANLSTGVIDATANSPDATSISDEGGGWFRISVTATATATSTQNFIVYLDQGTSGAADLSWDGDTASGAYLWGAQLNLGATLLSYVPTTTAAVWEPRFDHVLKSRTNHIRNNTMQGAVDATPGNLLLQSEDFSTTWSSNGTATVLTDQVANPDDGAVDADKITFGATEWHRRTQFVSVPIGVEHTFSVWLRADEAQNFQISGEESGNDSLGKITVAVTTSWQRFDTQVTYTLSDGWSTKVYIRNSTSGQDLEARSVYAWGAQLEAKPYVDTYVATTVSAVATSFGTAPTIWSVGASGTTVKLVGTGTESGVDYIDYRFAGTPTGDPLIDFETTTAIDALAGETWTASSYVAIIDGDTTNLSDIRYQTLERAENGDSEALSSDIFVPTSNLGRFEATNTLADAQCAHVLLRLLLNWDSSGDIDITLRIGLPQMERASAATDAIKTYGGAVTVDEWRDHNLALQSADLTTTWVLDQATYNTNVIANPVDGAVNAYELLDNTADDEHWVAQAVSVIIGHKYTQSWHAKASSADWVQVLFGGTPFHSSQAFANFNLATGAAGTIGTAIDAWGIEAVGSAGWYRIWATSTADSTASSNAVAPALINNTNGARFLSYAGSTTGVYLWGGQLTKGTELLDYTATTTAAVAATLEFVPVGLSVYEARTNMTIQSEAMDVTWENTWAGGVTIGPNVSGIIAPDGTETVNSLKQINNNGDALTSAYTLVVDTVYTFSAFVKNIDATDSIIYAWDNVGGAREGQIAFNWASKRLTLSDGASGGSVTNIGNDWYRISFQFTSDGSNTAHRIVVRPESTDTATQGIYFWGVQVEVGAFPTPYVSTTTDEVDATGDVATMTGTNFTSWFNEGGPGTMLAVATANSINSYDRVWAIGDGSSTDTIEVARNSSDTRGFVEDNNVTGGSTNNSGAFVQDIETSIAFAWDTNDASLVTDGGTPNTDTTSVVLPTSMTSLTIGDASAGSDILNGNIARITYWPFRKSNKFLTEITS